MILAEPLVWDERFLPPDWQVTAHSGATLVARAELMPNTIWGEAGIWGVFVHEDHRRRGHGREIMRRLLEMAASHGYSAVWLKVESHNDPAIALYDSLGFTVEERGAEWGVKHDTMRLVLS